MDIKQLWQIASWFAYMDRVDQRPPNLDPLLSTVSCFRISHRPTVDQSRLWCVCGKKASWCKEGWAQSRGRKSGLTTGCEVQSPRKEAEEEVQRATIAFKISLEVAWHCNSPAPVMGYSLCDAGGSSLACEAIDIQSHDLSFLLIVTSCAAIFPRMPSFRFQQLTLWSWGTLTMNHVEL